MKDIAILYWSGTGNTEKMAEIVAAGVSEAGGTPHMYTTDNFSIEELRKYSALAMGCPAMGDEVLEESDFAPVYNSIRPLLSDMATGLFGSYGWGDGEWMRNWADDCASVGCQLVTEPVICCYEPDEAAVQGCKNLGAMLVEVIE